MNLIDTTDQPQTDAITFEFDLPYKPENVWRALTDPALLDECLLPTVGLQIISRLERTP
ncbi:hypothetical protein WME99_20865 [Sorangium sp. So ce136]|uniref:hypothetical protein n=1 Tax=Sorangium sp. So ce136 TaxID=3133284 RepID=UPI003EFBD778